MKKKKKMKMKMKKRKLVASLVLTILFSITCAEMGTTQSTLTDVALFDLDVQDGDFGFDICQKALDTTATNLKGRGYTKAVFFGSTPNYNFADIATDADALAITEGTVKTGNLAVFFDNGGENKEPKTTFSQRIGGQIVSASITLEAFLERAVTGLKADDFSSDMDASSFVSFFGGGSTGSWSFTKSADATYDAENSCKGATSSRDEDTGKAGTTGNLAYDAACHRELYVVCVAR